MKGRFVIHNRLQDIVVLTHLARTQNTAMIPNLSSWEIFDILGRYSKGSGLIYVEWFRTPAGFGIDIRAAAAVNMG
jgi:hypothetical protein